MCHVVKVNTEKWGISKEMGIMASDGTVKKSDAISRHLEGNKVWDFFYNI